MEKTLTGKLPVVALSDVEKFIESAQHLKALTHQLHTLRCRDSRRQAALSLQINTFTQLCGALVDTSPRLAELWTQTQHELTHTAPGTFTAPALASTAGPAPSVSPKATPPQPTPSAHGGNGCSRAVPPAMRAGRTAD